MRQCLLGAELLADATSLDNPFKLDEFVGRDRHKMMLCVDMFLQNCPQSGRGREASEALA